LPLSFSFRALSVGVISDDTVTFWPPERVPGYSLAVTDKEPESEGELPVEAMRGDTSHPRIGSFRFFFEDERWEWSPQVEQMHGYEPGSVTPTTELVLSHKHPDDMAQVAGTLDEVRQSRGAFSTRHRIIDAKGALRDVVVIGERLSDDNGAVIGTQGFYVDVTPSERVRQELVSEAVAEIAENRGAIERAKGMLMMIYRISADTAFDLLKWRSQQTNVKLRLLAEQLSSDFLALHYEEQLPSRAVFDQMLMSAHLRVNADYEEERDVAS
jgi:PAS domain S-box-containing protein